MASDASIPLQVQSAPPPANPLGVIGALSQLKETQARIALQNAQLQTANANTADIQQQTASRERTNQAYSRVADLMKDPEIAAQVGGGDISAFQRAGIDPKVINEVHQGVQGRIKDAQAIDSETQKKNAGYHEVIGKALDGLVATYGKDPDALKANWLPTVNNLIAEGVLKKGTFPEQINGPEDIQRLAATNNFFQASNNAALSRKDAQQKIDTSAATAKKDVAQAGQADATAAIEQFKLNLMKGMNPTSLAQNVDGLIDPVKFPQANKDAKAAAANASASGDPAKVAEAVQHVYDEQVGSVAKQAALLPGAVKEAGAKAIAEIPARVAGAVQTQQALAKQSPDAFAGIVDANARHQAENEADKIYKEYTDKASQTQVLLDTIKAAQNGNKAAPGVIPIEQVRSVLSNGRINSQELKAVSSQAGSLMDRVEGWVNKNTSGQPIPPEILRDTATLAVIQQQAAKRTFNSGLDRLGMRGADVKKLPPPNIGGQPSHAVGDVVSINGKNVRITAIHPDGTFDGTPQ